MSDVIADLRRDLEQRLNEIDRRLADVQPLMDEQEKIRAALARAPFAGGVAPDAARDARRARRASARRAGRTAKRSSASWPAARARPRRRSPT